MIVVQISTSNEPKMTRAFPKEYSLLLNFSFNFSSCPGIPDFGDSELHCITAVNSKEQQGTAETTKAKKHDKNNFEMS